MHNNIVYLFALQEDPVPLVPRETGDMLDPRVQKEALVIVVRLDQLDLMVGDKTSRINKGIVIWMRYNTMTLDNIWLGWYSSS